MFTNGRKANGPESDPWPLLGGITLSIASNGSCQLYYLGTGSLQIVHPSLSVVQKAEHDSIVGTETFAVGTGNVRCWNRELQKGISD